MQGARACRPGLDGTCSAPGLPATGTTLRAQQQHQSHQQQPAAAVGLMRYRPARDLYRFYHSNPRSPGADEIGKNPSLALALRAQQPSTACTPLSDDYSTIEVARLLGMAVRSVQMMVDRGELEAWKTPGGHRRIARSSVERWWASRQHRGDTLPAPLDTLPAALSPWAATAPAALEPVDLRGGGNPPLQADTPSVLLIEDSVHYQNLISLLVRQLFPGVRLQVADDGIAGLAMAGRLQPRVMIVDIQLPGIDGVALITSLRSHPQFAGIGLIVVTSLDEADRAPYAFALAGLPVIHKSRLVAQLPGQLEVALQMKAGIGR